jgi:hypothetical protein
MLAQRVAAPLASETRLRGGWLLLARVGWIFGVGLDLTLFAVGTPAFFAEIATGCMARGCGGSQVALEAGARLHALGLSLNVLAWLGLALNAIVMLPFAVVGVVLFWRRADDPVALLASFTFFIFPIALSDVTNTLAAPWSLPAQLLNVLGGAGIFLLLFVFPNGRFVPSWTRWVWAGSIISPAAQAIFPSFRLPLNTVTFIVLMVSVLGAQVYRYRSVSTPLERQQTKVVVFGVSTGLVGALIATVLTTGSVPLPFNVDTPLYPLVFVVLIVSPMLFPISFGLAIQRSHLWEIDTIIKKSLVYGLLTGLLGALYAGMIVGLTTLAGAINRQLSTNPLLLVIATLAIAAFFQPLRQRIQTFIDRRFYRRKYDAAKTLDAFSASLRDQIDLEHLCEQLLAVVRETTQPVSISLWLLPRAQHGMETARAREPHGATTPDPR